MSIGDEGKNCLFSKLGKLLFYCMMMKIAMILNIFYIFVVDIG
jgi:hypothetical protein